MPQQSSRDLLVVSRVVVSLMPCGSVLSTNKVSVLDTAEVKGTGDGEIGGLWDTQGKQHMETAVPRQLCFAMYSLYNYHVN